MDSLFAPQDHAPRWYERYPRALPVGIFVLTMLVTLLSVFAIERAEAQRASAQLGQTAQSIASSLERRATANATYLRSGAALFATQQVVAAPLFQTFVGQLRLDGNLLGAEGIGWAMRVERRDIPMLEGAMRTMGMKDFTVHPGPAADHAYAVPVVYIQPDTPRNRRALGYNLFSEPVRRDAMLQALRDGRPTASGKVTLVQEGKTSGAPGFLIFMPVYAMNTNSANANPASRDIKGFVYSPFNAERFLRSSIDADRLDGVGIRLYDQSAAPGNLMAELPLSAHSGKIVKREIDLAHRSWLLEVEAPPSPTLSMLSVVTLLFGLLVATLLLVLARLVAQQAAEDRLALNWFEQQSSIRNSLTRELNHRVKNTIANVLSIIALTRRRSNDLQSFADSLEGRIRALSATHDLLTQSEWGTTPIRAVIEAEMAPYALDTDRDLELDGPAVELAPNDALSLGLAIHELATNAAKYGALSVLEGKVIVRWRPITQDLARIEWIELNGPVIDLSVARKRGFGTDLIEKIVAHELRNPVDLHFEEGGVRCSLIIPVRQPSSFSLRPGK
ncbi:CHASE domain-containing protein [Novosphingobium lentum]|uniref:CHASE domain-containing protein n=1 Tax=Novosphingobium lentum TaxID=145287 RepID=UPI00083211F0|nr:CHASE domain-containing protein [Novosphingobium lentum]